MSDPSGLTVVMRALAVPRAENRTGGKPELFDRVGRKWALRVLLHDTLEILRDRPKILCRQLGVIPYATLGALCFEPFIERTIRNAENDRAKHLY